MELLDAVNICLTALGEARVTSTSTRHPTVDLAIQSINTKKKLLQERGWWFNTALVTTYPDTLKRIPYPADAIAIKGADGYCVYSKRGGYLFDNTNNTEYFDNPLRIFVTYDLAFDDLPESAATVVTYQAAREMYVGDLGNDSSVSNLMQNEQQAALLLQEQHLRNQKYNTRRRRQWGRYIGALNN